MRFLLITLLLFCLCSCGSNAKKEITTTPQEELIITDSISNKHSYTEHQLIQFLDSIGSLSPISLTKLSSNYPDSVFRNRISKNIELSKKEFSALKQACKTGEITPKKIPSLIKDDTLYNKQDSLKVTFISFDKQKNDFEYFAISFDNTLGMSWNSKLFFFHKNTLISIHDIYHRYGLDLKHYQDYEGKTVIYYAENFQSGSGIWWFNYYFYQFNENNLSPILNEISRSNLQFPWANRSINLNTEVLQTNPLKIKMVYEQMITDSIQQFIYSTTLDSTITQYDWNATIQQLEGKFDNSKLSKEQLLSYYLDGNELLFINTHYKFLTKGLENEENKQVILSYLATVKQEL